MSVPLEHEATSYRIAAIAESRLGESSHPALRKILCKYDQGVLVLRGRLTTFFHTQLAQEIVGRVEGVERVVNQIEVVSSPI